VARVSIGLCHSLSLCRKNVRTVITLRSALSRERNGSQETGEKDHLDRGSIEYVRPERSGKKVDVLRSGNGGGRTGNC